MSLVFCIFECDGDTDKREYYERRLAEIQDRDEGNTYLSPLSFAGAHEDAISDEGLEKRIWELLDNCDSAIVLGQQTETIKAAVERAKRLRVPIRFLD